MRSALQALAHDHIVTIERHRGAFVSAPTIADAQDIFHSRRMVESGIALEVAANHPARATSHACARCWPTSRRRCGAATGRSAIRLSGAFHMAIARIRGEGALTRFLGGLIRARRW